MVRYLLQMGVMIIEHGNHANVVIGVRAGFGEKTCRLN